MNRQQRIFGLRLSAIFEIIIGLIVLVLIDLIFGDGDMYYDVNPHPFWLIVILVAAQYGANEALLAAALSTLVFLIGGLPARAEDVDIFTYYYDILINPILWFSIGLLAGVFTERHLRTITRLEHELQQSQEREEKISESYTYVRDRKEELEVQISGKLTSSVQAYRAAKAIEKLNPHDVLKGVEDLIGAILSPQSFSVYLLHDDKLTASIMHGWGQEGRYHAEFGSHTPIYQQVIGNQQTLCIVNSDHEITLDRQGVLAGPIIDPNTKRVMGMLKIEQMDFVNLSLNNIETFKALCEWIASSLVNAENYQVVKADTVINPDHNLMTYNFFQRQSNYLLHLAKRVGFDVSMIVVRITDPQKIDETERLSVARQLSQSVKNVLRNVDLAFEYQTDGEEYSILLPATSQDGANIVREKISSDLAKNLTQKQNANFSYIVQAVHEAA